MFSHSHWRAQSNWNSTEMFMYSEKGGTNIKMQSSWMTASYWKGKVPPVRALQISRA